MSQPLAQTLDIGVPEPVADAGYHFVGWNLKIEYMQGPSRMSAPVETSHAEERLFFLSQVDPAAYVPVWPLDNYYISKLTFTAMFAHDPASDPGRGRSRPESGRRRRRGRFRPEAARASPQAARSEAVGRSGAAEDDRHRGKPDPADGGRLPARARAAGAGRIRMRNPPFPAQKAVAGSRAGPEKSRMGKRPYGSCACDRAGHCRKNGARTPIL